MEPEDYVVYAGERGFWGKGNQYTSSFAEAKRYTHPKAIEFCRTRFSSNIVGVPALPVRVEDAIQVMNKK